MNPDQSNQNPISPPTPPSSDVVATGTDIYNEKVKAESLSLGSIENLNSGAGINLIPKLTKAEAVLEQRKSGVNYVSVFVVLFVALLSLGIVGFNFLNREILKTQKEDLAALETEVRRNSGIIDSNDAILQRIELLELIEESTFSPKEVFIYWLDLSNEFGEIDRVELTGGLEFTFSGKADSLLDAARLWHLLSVDSRVSEIELESVSNTDDGVTYRFKGSLDFEYFASRRVEETDN